MYQFVSEFYKEVLENKYCFDKFDHKKKKMIKETFDEAIARVAREVNKYDSVSDEMQAKTIKFITQKDFCPAGGIWRAAGNPSKNVSFVNCTTQVPVKDSLENIVGESLLQWCQVASFGQGNGIDISGLRPRGAKTHNCAQTSTGAVSFLALYDSAMQVISAKNRRGATKPDLWVYHPDSSEFIACKSDTTQLSSQNISVKVDNAFMRAVEQNKQITLNWERKGDCVYVGNRLHDDFSPGPEMSVKRRVKAKDLFAEIAYQAWKTGEPGMEFWETSEYWSNSNSHPDKKYHIVSTNGCSEQKLDPLNTCVLSSVNFYNMPLSSEDWQSWLKERVEFGIRFLDNVVICEHTENRSPHPTQKQKLKDLTRIGLGFTGLYDWFVKNKVCYGSKQSLLLIEEVMKVFSETAYRTSIALGKERGSFLAFSQNWFTQSPFLKRLCQLTTLKPADFTHLRHVCCLSIAPTGTLSMVLGVGGYGCEPSFAPYYSRKERVVTGRYRSHFIYDNCILNELKKRGTTVTKKNVEKLIESDEWVFAAWDKSGKKKNIEPVTKINLLAILYKYIDSGISVTYNLPNSATVEDVKNIYVKAWKNGLKSVAIYRDKSRAGILTNSSQKKIHAAEALFQTGCESCLE